MQCKRSSIDWNIVSCFSCGLVSSIWSGPRTQQYAIRRCACPAVCSDGVLSPSACSSPPALTALSARTPPMSGRPSPTTSTAATSGG
ncbi:hypothetical protein NL676_018067 [Syzygium grande]|nr:hypothetical protein NL676_018067 [Syzygium grande]